MKVKVYVPAQVVIPERALPELARRCRARGATYGGQRGSGVGTSDLVEQARRDGLIELPEDHVMDADEPGIFIRGRMTTYEAEWRRARARRRKKGRS